MVTGFPGMNNHRKNDCQNSTKNKKWGALRDKTCVSTSNGQYHHKKQSLIHVHAHRIRMYGIYANMNGVYGKC